MSTGRYVSLYAFSDQTCVIIFQCTMGASAPAPSSIGDRLISCAYMLSCLYSGMDTYNKETIQQMGTLGADVSLINPLSAKHRFCC